MFFASASLLLFLATQAPARVVTSSGKAPSSGSIPPMKVSFEGDPSSLRLQIGDANYTAVCNAFVAVDQSPSFEFQPCDPTTFQYKFTNWNNQFQFDYEVDHAVQNSANEVSVRIGSGSVKVQPSPTMSFTALASEVPMAAKTPVPEGWVGDLVPKPEVSPSSG